MGKIRTQLEIYIDSIGQAILDALEGISYIVDTRGMIVAFGRLTWNEFAAENEGLDALREENVIGRKLIDFVSGADVRAAYVSFMNELRADPEKKIIIPCRCDSPTERRELRLSISAVRSENHVIGYLYVSALVSTRTRPPLSLFDRQSIMSWTEEQRGFPILIICSYCHRVRQEGEGVGEWIEATEYYRRGGTDAVRLSHGLCVDCKCNIVDPQVTTLENSIEF